MENDHRAYSEDDIIKIFKIREQTLKALASGGLTTYIDLIVRLAANREKFELVESKLISEIKIILKTERTINPDLISQLAIEIYEHLGKREIHDRPW